MNEKNDDEKLAVQSLYIYVSLFNKKNKKSYAKAVGIFTSTKKNGKWGLQLRIMIPASGDVTLAGAKIN